MFREFTVLQKLASLGCRENSVERKPNPFKAEQNFTPQPQKEEVDFLSGSCEGAGCVGLVGFLYSIFVHRHLQDKH